eukprot:gene24134-45675_t
MATPAGAAVAAVEEKRRRTSQEGADPRPGDGAVDESLYSRTLYTL